MSCQNPPSPCLVLITGSLTPVGGGFQASRWVWLRGSTGRRLKSGKKGEAGVAPCPFLPHGVSGELLHPLPPFILVSHHLSSGRAAFHNLPKSESSLPLCKSTSSLTDMRRTIQKSGCSDCTIIPVAHIISQLLPMESPCLCPRLTVSESQASICLALSLNLLLEKQDVS